MKEEFVVMRARKEIRNKMFELARKRNKTLTAITDQALKEFLENNEFTFEDLLLVIQNIPSLNPSIEKIKNEMNGCPASICRRIMEIIQDKQVYLFEGNFEEIEERIKNLDRANLSGIFIHLTIKEHKINKINEILKKITEILKGSKIKLHFGAKSNHHDKFLLFVAYNKKESENVKK